ncbi:UDP-glucose/GDP-mannose dehydrogenase family protein [Cohnella sp. AR92]|uniref:UDP-glucose dehydrogenase family protein n=1 Tax=Cohnella sp. AR92 TaxID=648716 RepID=UPI000F8CB067|nr:UDP-glucose/GDP-mannose dehydrogenase family protein [Cohnella sp. AR92]RUS47297.1 UDP-glucose/GDP-mannose dehydrogenase family protein [Cohnella sp. AR92]
MRAGIIGTGYVGLVYGTVLAKLGHEVICADVDENKIQRLNHGEIPIHEAGLAERLQEGIANGRLRFTTDLAGMIRQSEVLMITVGTPPRDDGSSNTDPVLSVAAEIGEHMNGPRTVVMKSTVPVGTTRQAEAIIRERLRARGVDYPLGVAMNPEFLKEGTALKDAMEPSRVVIGTDSELARETLAALYKDYSDQAVPFVHTNPETAEMIKYASNSFLALKVAFINEFALLSEKVGANVIDLAYGMGLDSRIGPRFLQAGAGYGGSCFPKDNSAIIGVARQHGLDLLTVRASQEANERHQDAMVERIAESVGPGEDLSGRTIAILGLSFKPGTDDVRESPSLHIIRKLAERGASIRAYCPHGMEQAALALQDCVGSIVYAEDEYSCAANADALVLVTDWPQFLGLDLRRLKASMRGQAMLDLRNMFAANGEIRQLFDYRPIGLKRRGG